MAWMKDMMWPGYMGGNRALAVACWLGTAIVAESWRLPVAAIAIAIRRHRAAAVRMAPVSRMWLREYEAEYAKHEDAT